MTDAPEPIDGSVLDAFRVLFLDTGPTMIAVESAMSRLRPLSIDAFTRTALAVLADTGPPPHDTTMCTRLRWIRRNVDSQPCQAWQFEVYLDGGSGRRRVDRWLVTDGSWAIGRGIQVSTQLPMSELVRTELTDTHRIGLIDGRAHRVTTWLAQPRGALQPAVV